MLRRPPSSPLFPYPPLFRSPRLPAEMSNLATALARLHALPLPAPADRPPLADHSRLGPIAGTLAVIERQVPALDEAGLPAATRHAPLAELAWARRPASDAEGADQASALFRTDTPPAHLILPDRREAGLVCPQEGGDCS